MNPEGIYLKSECLSSVPARMWEHSDDSNSRTKVERKYEYSKKGITAKHNHPTKEDTALHLHNNGVSPSFLESEEFLLLDGIEVV